VFSAIAAIRANIGCSFYHLRIQSGMVPDSDEDPQAVQNKPKTVSDRPTVAAEAFWTGSDIVTFETTGGAQRYQPLETIGEGGMGEVRLCADRRVGRQIAMKVLRKDHASRADLRGRFFREVRAQGQLEHPSIVPVYDVGTDETGALFFTMKRVRGQTLQQIRKALRRGDEAALRQHSLHRLLTAFGSACLAVDFAHARGFLHCDLKPANVMLGDFGEVYVLDWGLAKLPQAQETAGVPTAPAPSAAPSAPPGPEAPSGATPVVSGTAGYMAPEQVRGEALDARSDVYALGAILYELLTLEPMHTGKDAQALCESTLRGVAIRPTARAPGRPIDPELEAICLRACALDPKGRYASARALYDDLQRFLEGDRDLERRRVLSREHDRKAREAADAALVGNADGPAHRSRAMREVGRALAFDPDNAAALRTLVRMLTEPPGELPPEALDDMRSAERNMQRIRARAGGFAFLTWLFFIPAFVMQGINDMPLFVGATAAWMTASAICFHVARHPTPDGLAPVYLTAAASVAIGFSSVLMGPYILVPGFAAVFALGFTLSTDRARRYVPMVLACLAIALPMILSWLGVIKPWYEVDSGHICLVTHMMRIHPMSMQLLLPGNLVVVVMACYFGLRFRDSLTDMQKRLHLYTWQLKQLIPDEAKAPVSIRAGATPAD
jgi:serine/threonine protein kinase